MKKEKLFQLNQACQSISEEPMVFGSGNENAKLMLIGEAPGAKEIELKKPFVGQAGKNLDVFIKTLDIKRENIYITNTVKIRPYRINKKTGKKVNRPPNKEELKTYSKILHQEIDIIEPEIIITLGNYALKTLNEGPEITIGEVHGQPLYKKNASYILFPLYHPAAIIYNQKLKKTYMEDLLELKTFIMKR